TPAVTMVLAWHLLSRQLQPERPLLAARSRPNEPARRRGTSRRSAARGQPPQRVAAAVGELKKAGQRLSGAVLAAELGVSERARRRLLADVRVWDGGTPGGH